MKKKPYFTTTTGGWSGQWEAGETITIPLPQKAVEIDGGTGYVTKQALQAYGENLLKKLHGVEKLEIIDDVILKET